MKDDNNNNNSIINDIAEIFVSLYSYEIDINKKDFDIIKNNKFYILNPKWLNKLKIYINYDNIKNQINKNKKIEQNLNKDKNFLQKIKTLIPQNNITNFPEELKDEKIIKPSINKYENHKKKLFPIIF